MHDTDESMKGDQLSADVKLGRRDTEGQEKSGTTIRPRVEEDIDPPDIHRWAEEMNVTAEQVRVAIQRVGPSSTKVREFLGL